MSLNNTGGGVQSSNQLLRKLLLPAFRYFTPTFDAESSIRGIVVAAVDLATAGYTGNFRLFHTLGLL